MGSVSVEYFKSGQDIEDEVEDKSNEDTDTLMDSDTDND